MLENVEPHFAIIQRVTKIAAFINPGRWDPSERRSGELFDLVIAAARAGIGQYRHVWLIGDLEFLQHRFSIAAIVPNRHEIKFHLRIGFHDFEPAAVFQFDLAIRAPWRPEMNNAKIRGFDRGENLMLGRGVGQEVSILCASTNQRSRNQRN